MSRINFTELGFEDYLYWQSQDRKSLKKINALINSIKRNGPLEGEGKPEFLKHKVSGLYSRRIDSKNRLIYRYDEDGGIITIVRCKGHYED